MKAGDVALGVGIGGVVFAVVFVVRTVMGRQGRLADGQVPITALPQTEGQPLPANPCRAVTQWDWHLRPTEQLATTGAQSYPRGTEVIILQAGTLRRNGARIYRVRVARDNREGWCFLFPTEMIGNCRGASEEQIIAASRQPLTSANPTPGTGIVRS